jgi:hypothetical protein
MLTRLKFALVAVAERAVLAVRPSGLVHVQLDHFGASAMLVRPRTLVSVPFNGGVWHGEHMDGRVSPGVRCAGSRTACRTIRCPADPLNEPHGPSRGPGPIPSMSHTDHLADL